MSKTIDEEKVKYIAAMISILYAVSESAIKNQKDQNIQILGCIIDEILKDFFGTAISDLFEKVREYLNPAEIDLLSNFIIEHRKRIISKRNRRG